jgi:hypothetical protein
MGTPSECLDCNKKVKCSEPGVELAYKKDSHINPESAIEAGGYRYNSYNNPVDHIERNEYHELKNEPKELIDAGEEQYGFDEGR